MNKGQENRGTREQENKGKGEQEKEEQENRETGKQEDRGTREQENRVTGEQITLIAHQLNLVNSFNNSEVLFFYLIIYSSHFRFE